MKGFYRAVRRGEVWAVEINKLTGFARLLAMYSMHVDLREELKKRDFLLAKVEKDTAWQGGTITLPLFSDKS